MKKTIPESFKIYFWDVNIDEIDLEKHKRFVIERILNYGDHQALFWLKENYDETMIKEAVKKSRNLTRKTARFWQAYFNLSEEEMRCFTKF